MSILALLAVMGISVSLCGHAGALQALSQNLLSPTASAGGIPGSDAAVVPDSAADAIAAETAQASSMDVDSPAGQASTSQCNLPHYPDACPRALFKSSWT